MPETERSDEGSSVSAISVRGLSKEYGSGETGVTAFSGINFDIEQGSVVGILGPNGAGKTTLIKSVLDLITPTSGSIEIFGEDIHDNRYATYKRVGAMFEGARNIYWRLTVRQNLDFFARLDGDDPANRRERFELLLNNLNLAEKADTKVRNLSRGQKQKVAIATILSGNKELVFLDEPTLGLDVESSRELRRELDRLVDDEGMTVVLSSHDMAVIEELCDRVIIINDGNVVADDSIESLYEIFETDLYEITIEERIEQNVLNDLKRRFDFVTAEESSEGEIHYRFALGDANAVPDLTGALVESGVQLVKVSRIERDFEEIFLSVTDSDNEKSMSQFSVASTARGSGG